MCKGGSGDEASSTADTVLLKPPTPESPDTHVVGSVTVPQQNMDDKKSSDENPSVLMHALSGSMGGLFAEVVMYPMDIVRLNVQTAQEGRDATFLRTLARILRDQGVGGLYNGLPGALIREFIHSMSYFLWQGTLFRHFATHGDTTGTDVRRRLLINLAAKQLNWLCINPVEVISATNQLQSETPGFFSTTVSMYKKGGLGIFYRGLPLSLVLAINPAIMHTLITQLLALYAKARQAVLGEDPAVAREHSAGRLGAAAACSKIVATLLTYPLILTKVRQQTTMGGKSVPQVLRALVAEGGPLTLYRGVLPMMYTTALWNALMFAAKQFLAPRREKTPAGSPREATPAEPRAGS